MRTTYFFVLVFGHRWSIGLMKSKIVKVKSFYNYLHHHLPANTEFSSFLATLLYTLSISDSLCELIVGLSSFNADVVSTIHLVLSILWFSGLTMYNLSMYSVYFIYVYFFCVYFIYVYFIYIYFIYEPNAILRP